MITVTYDKEWGYLVDGETVSRHKMRVVREYRHVTDVVMSNACERARVLGQTVTVYQLPDGRWTHDKMGRC